MSFSRPLALALVLIPFAGCVHYAPAVPRAPFVSVYVAPVQNHSDAHEVQGLLWQHIATEIDGCPSLRLEHSPMAADAALAVDIRGFDQQIAATAPHDSARAAAYRLTLTAAFTLGNERTGEVFLEKATASASIDLGVAPDFVEARRRAMPRLSRELARKICSQLDSW